MAEFGVFGVPGVRGVCGLLPYMGCCMAAAGGCNGGSVCGRGEPDCNWWGEMAVGEGYD